MTRVSKIIPPQIQDRYPKMMVRKMYISPFKHGVMLGIYVKFQRFLRHVYSEAWGHDPFFRIWFEMG